VISYAAVAYAIHPEYLGGTTPTSPSTSSFLDGLHFCETSSCSPVGAGFPLTVEHSNQ
jgi:hypothetical protein